MLHHRHEAPEQPTRAFQTGHGSATALRQERWVPEQGSGRLLWTGRQQYDNLASTRDRAKQRFYRKGGWALELA